MIQRRQLLRQLASLPFLPAVAAAADGRRAPVGFLTGFTLSPRYRAAFEDGVRAGGFTPIIDERSAGGHGERLPEMARALVRTDVRLLVALEIPAIAALKDATATLPIVMAGAVDPLGAGMIDSLARPGRNVTGVSSGEISEGLSAKWVDILHDLVPRLKRVAVLSNPDNRATLARVRQIKRAAAALRLEIASVEVRRLEDLEAAFEKIRSRNAQGLIVVNDTLVAQRIAAVIDFAARDKLPAVYGVSRYAEEGGLVSYGTNYVEAFWLAATRYAVPLLNGKKPADLPVEQFVGLELVINRGVAVRLGLALPPTLLARANRIID